MSLATAYCRAALGVEAPLVGVEVFLGNGLPGFNIVGLPEKAVQESRERVRAALLNGGYDFPARRIIVNLSPAELPKEGGRFDLAIAVGILAASAQLPAAALTELEFAGELSLAGEIRPVAGLLPALLAAAEAGRGVLLPRANTDEASLISGLRCFAASHLAEVVGHLSGVQPLTPVPWQPPPPGGDTAPADLRDVKGQEQGKRALEIAAAGRHNLLFEGPPGTGKSMLASRLPGILPLLSEPEALEVAAIHSISGRPLDRTGWRRPPYRAPHHTASAVALVGGGSSPRPGEISLAHRGVLFLDELPEFERRVLEVLREPLEAGHITISRAARQADYPADVQLIAAMNPCPCGYHGDSQHDCRCTPDQIHRYQTRLSGPFLDRIDLRLRIPALSGRELSELSPGEDSATVATRVGAALERQQARQGCTNARLQGAALERHCTLTEPGQRLLQQATDRLALSPRAYHRVLRVARTIADLAASAVIEPPHLAEALSYRAADGRL